jgi:diguanylate cyclase (GGDEF)-like protein/PAS domain S-box-containing protein
VTSVLIVEDEPIVALDIERTLSDLGYDVAGHLRTGEEAILAAARLRPDLILIDIRLAGKIDGIDAARVIRAEREVPIVYLTSHSDESTVARAAATEPHGYILKPFGARDLRTTLEIAILRHRLEIKLKAALEEVEAKSALLQAILSSMEDSVVATDSSGNIILFNEAAERLIGPVQANLDLGDAPRTYGLFLPDQRTPCPLDQIPLLRAQRGERVKDMELFVRTPGRPDGGRWHSVNASPVIDARGVVRGAVTVGRDVTAIKAVQVELEQHSIVDELTGLYNRRGFHALAERQLKVCTRGQKKAALLFADLNGLKQINDRLGHPSGDAVLQLAARALTSAFRDSDIVARLGGDEFVVLAADADESSIDTLRRRLHEQVDALNAEESRPFALSMSVGASVYDPLAPTTVDELVGFADARMYEEKARRRARREGGA